MIIAKMEDCERYYALHPLLEKFFEYVKTHDFSEAKAGRIEIMGKQMFINFEDMDLQPREERPLEVHRRYIDVQIPLTIEEEVGWQPLSTLEGEPEVAYDEQRDVAFYQRPAASYVTVHPGEFYILFPEDAHAPFIGNGHMRKLIGKIKIGE